MSYAGRCWQHFEDEDDDENEDDSDRLRDDMLRVYDPANLPHVPPMARSLCLLIVPLSLLFAACDNRTQEDARWDEVYKDLTSGDKVQPWKDARESYSSSDQGKKWD